jgi:hypothetical protein
MQNRNPVRLGEFFEDPVTAKSTDPAILLADMEISVLKRTPDCLAIAKIKAAVGNLWYVARSAS